MLLLRNRILYEYHKAREISVEIEQWFYLCKVAKVRRLKFGTIQYLV